MNDSTHKNKPDIYVRLENADQLPEDLSGISALILPLENDFPIISGVNGIAEIPRGIISEQAIINRLEKFKQNGVDAALCGNLSAVKIAKDCGFKVMADTGLNVYNSQSANAIAKMGCSAVVLSNEMLLADAASLSSPIYKGIVSYGNIPLMLFKNCPIKNGKNCSECDKKGVLTDRKGIEFPVRCRMGYSKLLNSVPIWLVDKQIKNIDFQILYFTNESKERVNEVIKAYKNGYEPDCKYTRGLFFRGVI